MNEPWHSRVGALLGASVEAVDHLQSLWSGYGELVRLQLEGGVSVIAKRVAPPPDDTRQHPLGWKGDRGHARKLRSYEVEATFYESFAARCGPRCRVARLWHMEREQGSWLFVLEDLDRAGFPHRRGYDRAVEAAGLAACLDWLAAFHATFLGTPPEGLWEVGSYWHLDTRPDELAAMGNGPLKDAASALDERLRRARHQTLVHGDAKLANFCFAADHAVAAVDFQYVGGGVGVRDVAYLIGGARREPALSREAERWHDHYFAALRRALAASEHPDPAAVESEWRALLPVAYADFERFLAGWAPDHWKRSRYAEAQVARALVRPSVRPAPG